MVKQYVILSVITSRCHSSLDTPADFFEDDDHLFRVQTNNSRMNAGGIFNKGTRMAFETFYAPAKVNLYLEVLGRRPDGYHDLSMIMQRISLYDRIDISLGGDPGVRVVCEGVPLGKGEENIAARAAKRILDLSGERVGVDIRIEKKIPVAAGLGGGSSDAASVLLGLNDMLRLDLSREILMKEGGALGADVPFFVLGRTAWARGVGDVLEEID